MAPNRSNRAQAIIVHPKPKTVQEEPLKVGFGYEMATDPVTSQGSSLGDLHSANKFQRREENLGAENGRNMCKTFWTHSC